MKSIFKVAANGQGWKTKYFSKNLMFHAVLNDPVIKYVKWFFFSPFFSFCYHKVGMPAQTRCYFPVRCYSSSNLETKSLLKRCSMFLFGVIFETFFVVSQSLLFDHISKHDWGLTWITDSLKFIIFLRLADFFPSWGLTKEG